jgi:oxygen-independent coproporphyrinogen-3 oxidase
MNSSSLPWRTPRAAYLHVPFCAHHCGYCDFAVTAGQDHLQELYVEAVSLELASLKEPRPVETIFIGGGTPTYLKSEPLRRLLSDVRHGLPLKPGGEWSVESTPDSLSMENLGLLCDHGVTRISIGVQTFHEHLLPRLDRIHDPEQIATVMRRVAEFPLQVSLDLIFGIPGQTLEEWETDLKRAVEFKVDHLSTYGLTYEKGTPLWKQQQRGEIRSVTEELEAEMYDFAIDFLEAHGYEHYEISNFARPGKRCRHNEIYWANHAYFGFGVGAARYVDGSRELNVRNTQDYLRKMLSGDNPTFQRETLSDRERALETVAIQLCRREGIARQLFQEQTSINLDALIGSLAFPMIEQGLLHDSGESIRLTRAGKLLADAVIAGLMK